MSETISPREKRRRVRTLTSQLEKAVLRADKRSRVGKALLAEMDALREHVGEPSYPQVILIEQGARLRLLESLFWGEINDTARLVGPDGVVPAVDAMRSIGRELRQTLSLLGLERVTRDVTLRDIVDGRAELPERADDGND